MAMSDLNSWVVDAIFNSATYHTNPFQHAVLHDFLPPDTYATIRDNWPETGWRELVHPDQLKPDGHYRRRQQRAKDVFPDLAELEAKNITDAFFSTFAVNRPGELFPQALLLDDESGYWIRPHPDTPQKMVTVQVYLAPDKDHPECGTVMLDRKNHQDAFVSYLPNTGFAFPVTPESWHEVKPGVCKTPRRSLQLLFYTVPNPHIRYQ